MAAITATVLANNQGPGTFGPFTIAGGQFNMMARSAAWTAGNIVLQQQDPQGGFIPVQNGTLSANGQVFLQLSPGQYNVIITTATNVFANLVAIPTLTTR